MDTSADARGIGERVARARKAVGLNQVELAALVGKSESWMRSVEKGRIRLTKHATIDRLAEVLKIDIPWMLGQPYRADDEDNDAGHSSVPALRAALQRAGLILSGHPGVYPHTPLVPVADLREEVDRTTLRRQAANLPAVMWQLPGLAEALNTGLLQGSDNEAVYGLVVETGHVARMVLNQLGYHDLAWTAAETAALAADKLGDPLLKACSAWDRCGVLLHTGSLSEAIAVAEAAMRNLDERMGNPTPEELSLWGALQLRCAVASARREDAGSAWEWLGYAERTAARIGHDRNDFQTVFGPSNVQIHAAEIAVELDQPDVALLRHQQIDLTKVSSKERHTRHGIDVARAYGQLGRDEVAVQTLTHAAELAPHYVHNHPLARSLVEDLLHRGSTRAFEAGLGALERAMGMA